MVPALRVKELTREHESKLIFNHGCGSHSLEDSGRTLGRRQSFPSWLIRGIEQMVVLIRDCMYFPNLGLSNISLVMHTSVAVEYKCASSYGFLNYPLPSHDNHSRATLIGPSINFRSERGSTKYKDKKPLEPYVRCSSYFGMSVSTRTNSLLWLRV